MKKQVHEPQKETAATPFRKPLKHIAIMIASLIVYHHSIAQRFKVQTDSSLKNFYDIKVAFETDWQKKHGVERLPFRTEGLKKMVEQREHADEKREAGEKENEYIQFKRWENFVMPRVYPSGDLSLLSLTHENFKKYEDAHPAESTGPVGAAGTTGTGSPDVKTVAGVTTGAWTFVGLPGTNNSGRNAGRLNFIRFDPTNSSIIYAGAPAGGLWKSTDGGSTWSTNTDYLAEIGCSDLAINPTTPSIMYWATGDGDAGDTKSIGVFKTTDGGTTWATTGLTFTAGQLVLLSRIIVNPSNPSIVITVGTNGIWRSTDAAATWTQVFNSGGVFRDAEFMPGNPNIVYAGGSNGVYRSTDGGATWTLSTSGLPTTDIGRISIAVTPANSSYVYVLMTNGAGDMKGVYRSTNSGVSYSLRASTPNILGYDTSFSGNNQAYYDMSFAVSPVSSNTLLASGVISYRSTNGGTTWVQANTDCVNSSLAMHWDIHYIEFVPGSSTKAFAANDGGIYKTTNTGTCWTAVNQNNICVNQIYGFGMSTTDPEKMISGHQDGATTVWTDGSYNNVLGGDGFQCFIDRTNASTMYGELYLGGFCRSTDGGVNWTWLPASGSGLSGNPAWNTPWSQDPTTANTIWAGYEQVFKSTNQGTNWTQVGALPGSGSLVDVRVSPSNSNVVYAARALELYITQNGGSTWTSILSGLPNLPITHITVSETNPLKAWVTFSAYTDGQKVYQTTNGGSTWTNISAGLPNLPCNVVQYVPGSSLNEIYAGCDIGVYYKNDNLSSWVPFYTGLAHAPVTDLHIYKATGLIRASTYGRGVWTSPLRTITTASVVTTQDTPATPPAVPENKISIYPNPVNDMFMVIVPGSIKSIKVYDASGKLVDAPNFESSGFVRLNHTLRAGVYSLVVTITDGRTWTRQIVKL